MRENWALFVAAVLIGVVAITVVVQIYWQSAHGQLRSRVSILSRKRKELRQAGVAVKKAEQRVFKTDSQADRIRPRLVQEAKDALTNSQALHKTAHDQVLVAENHLRRIILEEFPPRRHAFLRARYLPYDQADENPFSS